jgi:hypothetical protein
MVGINGYYVIKLAAVQHDDRAVEERHFRNSISRIHEIQQ